MLFRAVIQGVPAQVFGVRTVGMAPRHRDEQGGDIAATRGENFGDLVRRRAGQFHVNYSPSE